MTILVVISIVLMILDQRIAATAELRAVLSLPLVPLQYVVSYPIQLIDDLNHSVSTRRELIKENLDLKAQQLLLTAQMQRLVALETENTQLKALLSSSTKIQGKVLIAQILAVDSDPFINQVTLDKGSSNGVFIGQPVLDSTGVMGKVIQVGPYTSRILLINDSKSGVPVQNARNGIRAIAIGDSYLKTMRLSNVTQTADIKVGDMLVTSGLGEHFPEGYPVGKVISIIKDPGLEFATITIEPSAHLDRSRQVLLVWPPKEAFVKAPLFQKAQPKTITMQVLPPPKATAIQKSTTQKSKPIKNNAADQDEEDEDPWEDM